MNMTSTIVIQNQLKLQLLRTQYAVLTKTNELQDDHAQWYLALSFLARMVIYVAILALLVIIVSLILKYMGDCDGEETLEQVTATETNRLLPKKAIPFTYGTCEEDLESGKCSSSSSDDLYDGKLCIFCYDEQRNCFFVPCGHCAACYVCAQRIVDGESKTCPVCRRYIRKVRKLFTSQNQTSG
uniref:RING-type domain-containing protein n=1 Tax=Davidia involucrata TaxID=16924 RepID=A0A5B7BPV5_DAVIN